MSDDPANINSATHNEADGDRRKSSFRMKSSFFTRARMSFLRTGGTRGASVENLRGTKGARFEGRGKITRGAEGALGCGCFAGGGGRDGHKERFLLIKGPFCFVFSNEDAPSPKYAIGLNYMRPNVKPVHRDGRVTVLLENNLGDLEYEFSFANEEIALRFKSAVEVEATSAQTEAVRKRLGHEHLLTKRASIVFAENIAKAKESEQPDKPVSAQDIATNMPLVAM